MATTPPVPSTFSSAADNALAGGQQPAAAAPPVYQAPPVQAPPTFFGRILQGALNGLAGGLRQGQENIAGAGTPGFTPGGNGAAYAQQLQQQQDQQKAQQAQGAQNAAQQSYENKRTNFQDQQAQQAAQIQAVNAKLSNLHTAQQIHNADQETQGKYFSDQQRQLDALNQDPKATVTVVPHVALDGMTAQDRGAAYIKAHPEFMADPNTKLITTPNGDGVDLHFVKADANARMDSDEINKQLAAVGSTYKQPAGTSMSYADANSLIQQESHKHADAINTQAIDDHKSKLALHNSLVEGNQKFAQAQALTAQKLRAQANGGADIDPEQPLNRVQENRVDQIKNGDLDIDAALKGLGGKAKESNDILEARYNAKFLQPKLSNGQPNPSYDSSAAPFSTLRGQYKASQGLAFNDSIRQAASLLGSTDPDGTKHVGDIDQLHNTLLTAMTKYGTPFTRLDAQAKIKFLKQAGDESAAAVIAKAPEVALKGNKFASGGGAGSQAQYEDLVNSLIDANTVPAINERFAAMKDTAGNQLRGLIQDGGIYATKRLKGITDPGTENSVSAKSQNLSGARTPLPATIPAGMKPVRVKSTGEIKLVPK
jgi:hypothetical protein